MQRGPIQRLGGAGPGPADAIEASRVGPGQWFRRIVVGILVVLASLTFSVATVGVWANHNFLNNEAWVDQVGRLPEDTRVREAVATFTTSEVMKVIGPADLFREMLPEQGRVLAVPLAVAMRGLVEEATENFLASSYFRRVWVLANERAHRDAVKVLRDEGSLVRTGDGRVVLNFVPLIDGVLRTLVSMGPELLGREVDLSRVTVGDLPEEASGFLSETLGVEVAEDFGQVTVHEADSLRTAQAGIRLFDTVWPIAVAAALVTGALALWRPRNRRAVVLQLCAGVAAGMVVVRWAAGHVQGEVLALVKDPLNRGATDAVTDAFLDSLYRTTGWILVAGVAVAAVALVGGPYPAAVRLRARAKESTAVMVGVAQARSRDEATVAWVRAHEQALKAGGAVAAVTLALVGELQVSSFTFVALAGLLVAYESAIVGIVRGASEDEPAPGDELDLAEDAHEVTLPEVEAITRWRPR